MALTLRQMGGTARENVPGWHGGEGKNVQTRPNVAVVDGRQASHAGSLSIRGRVPVLLGMLTVWVGHAWMPVGFGIDEIRVLMRQPPRVAAVTVQPVR